MIVAAVMLLLSPTPAKPPCVAWRDSSGRILDARGMQERREAVRRQMFDGLKERSSPIQETLATPPCVRRAGEPLVAPSPSPSPSPSPTPSPVR